MSHPKGGVALIRLHRVLIAAGVALAIIFGVYQFRQLQAGAEDALVWMVISIVLGVSLSAYYAWFNKKQRRNQ